MEAMQAAQGSKEDREEFAKELLPRAADVRNIRIAIDHVASSGQAPGPSGLRLASLGNEERWNLAGQLVSLVAEGSYRPGRAIRKAVPKGDNRGTRPVQVLDQEDRVVERAITQVIQPFLMPSFMDSNLHQRRREEALALAERTAFDRNRWTWISEDFRDAFEHVPISRLLQILRQMLPAEDICSFIGQLVAKANGMGLRQGGPLSPLLLNVYLHHMLDAWWLRQFPGVPLLRVVDDLLILAKPEEAAHLYQELRQRAIAIGMALKGSSASSICDLEAEQQVKWLGYRIIREDSLRVSIAGKSWDKLEEHLQLAWEQPVPPLAANESILGWIGQQGAAYREEDVERICVGIQRRAWAQGFTEIPERGEIASVWSQAHHRDWVTMRRWVFLRERHGIELARGFARQHRDIRNSVRNEAVARFTAAPQPTAGPIRREVIIYTDGSCDRQTRIGGWAYLLVNRETGYQRSAADSLPRTTNNRMELTAALEGLRSLDQPMRVHVVTDSKFVHDGLTVYLPEWIARGWRRRSGGPIAHRRLWQRVAQVLDLHQVDCQWIRGHSGQPQNELVHQLAQEAASSHLDHQQRTRSHLQLNAES